MHLYRMSSTSQGLFFIHSDGVRAGAKGAIAPVNFEDLQKNARMHQILMTQQVNISHFLKICTRQFEILMPALLYIEKGEGGISLGGRLPYGVLESKEAWGDKGREGTSKNRKLAIFLLWMVLLLHFTRQNTVYGKYLCREL